MLMLLLAPFLFIFGLINLLFRTLQPCPFCKIANGKLKAKILDENEHCICFADHHPAAEHHFLVIPRKHVRDIGRAATELTSDEMEAMIEMGRKVQQKHGGLAQFRMVFSRPIFAMIPHLHLHVVSTPLKCTWLRGQYLLDGIFHVTAQEAMFNIRHKQK